MSAIPVTITPDAAAHVAQLGMRAELERMLEHALHTVPGLRAIEVNLALPYDTGDEPKIVIDARRAKPGSGYDPTDADWAEWKHDGFSRDVWDHFILMSRYETPHAGQSVS